MKLENKIENMKNWTKDFCKDPHFYLALTAVGMYVYHLVGGFDK